MWMNLFKVIMAESLGVYHGCMATKFFSLIKFLTVGTCACRDIYTVGRAARTGYIK
jgi:hypothetical protein